MFQITLVTVHCCLKEEANSTAFGSGSHGWHEHLCTCSHTAILVSWFDFGKTSLSPLSPCLPKQSTLTPYSSRHLESVEKVAWVIPISAIIGLCWSAMA